MGTRRALSGVDIEIESDGRASFDKRIEEIASVACAREMDASSYYGSQTGLTGAKQTIPLGAAYRNLHVWLDPGSPDCHIALGGAADTNDPKITDADEYKRTFDEDGVSNVYIESLGSAGKINVEAW